MARILAYCDSPTAPTGFGRSAKHVLHALHAAGHEIVQLAVNHNPATTDQIPWKLYTPSQPGDPYGVRDLPRILQAEQPFDLLWTTFDPECPWGYQVPGVEPKMTVLQLLASLRASNPGFRLMGWFPVDAGPLSDFEMAILAAPQAFDLAATMSTHVHDLVEWTLKLKGVTADLKAVKDRIRVVPHGVDMDAYRVATDEARTEAKRKLGFDPEAFLIVQVERNQPRKMPFNGLALLEKVKAALPGRKVALYQHMMDDEETRGCGVGYRMRELAWRYGLVADKDVRWPARPFSDEEMVDLVYAAADVVFSGSAGEGFQYPLWEALACGRRVVAPNDSARGAWLGNTPGAHLYRCGQAENVIRGSYYRRMGRPDVAHAAKIVTAMVEGKLPEVPTVSREWVAARADHRFVQKWWVDAVADQERLLREERFLRKVTVSDPGDYVVNLRRNLGLGDMVMAGPALRALAESRPGKRMILALPPTGLHRTIAEWMKVGDAVQTQPGIPIETLGPEVLDPSHLWHPLDKADPEWMGRANRTDCFLKAFGLEDTRVDAYFPCPTALVKAANEQMGARFGVKTADCIVLALESAQRNRTLPANYVVALAGKIRAAGYFPVLIGRNHIDTEKVGFINLTGKTDLMATFGLIGACAATVAVDSFPLHVAAAMQRPTVALMSLHEPRTRLAHYRGPMQVLIPEAKKLAGEEWPPGEYGSPMWIDSFRPDRIARALGVLLDKPGLFEPTVVEA
jgi:ADP-heptose:LPS heptosyltransferase